MKSIKKIGLFLLRYVPLILGFICVLVPVYWVTVTAFKKEANVLRRPAQYIPDPITVENFKTVWGKSGFSNYFLNTFIVAIIVAVITVAFSILAAYAISRYKFKGKSAFLIILLITQMFPGAMLIVPLFMIFKNMGLISSLWSLVISYTAVQVPFSAVLMKSFIDDIPYEIEEAAMIDGCNRFSIIIRIIMPLLIPGIVAIAAFSFMNSWNEFLFPMMFINKQSNFVISIGLLYMIGQNTAYYGALAAGSLIAAAVPVILFVFFQKYMVKGLSSGAVKA